jgi:hypothetical protein
MTGTIVLTACAALAVAGFASRRAHRAWRRYRGTRVLTCPRSERPAALELDRSYSALTALIGPPRLRLSDCSSWAAGQRCVGECLPLVAAAPDAHLVRSLLDRWSAGKTCALCGGPFSNRLGGEFGPALLSRDGYTFERSVFRPEKLPQVLATHQPVCWYCHVVHTLRRERLHVVARPRTASRSPARN